MGQRTRVLPSQTQPSRFRPAAWAVVVWLTGMLTSCTPGPAPQPAAVAPRQPATTALERRQAGPVAALIPGGDPFADNIEYEFAIYYLPTPSEDPLPELKALVESKYPLFTFRDSVPDETKADEKPRDEQAPTAAPARSEATVTARIERNVPNEYAPPDEALLTRFGHGLTKEQIEQLAGSKQALILQFAYPRKHIWDGLLAAQGLMAELAAKSGGLIWDEETREVFAPAAWKERLADWAGEVPDLSRHTVIHAYRKEEFLRAITLGMGKFGLPDIVVEGFSPSLTRNTGSLMNLFAQALAEGAQFPERGEFDLNLKSIQNAQVREQHLPHLLENATGIALLTLRQGTPEEGDPENRLVELTFDRGTGPDSFARHEAVLSQTFGSSDNVTHTKHDAELKAASELARTKLPSLRSDFNEGLEPGETLLVKAPFETPDDGREWMWVEVVRWKTDTISGLLMNEPHAIPDLHAGQQVDVSEADVFDYLRRHPDGSTEGNETGKIIGRKPAK